MVDAMGCREQQHRRILEPAHLDERLVAAGTGMVDTTVYAAEHDLLEGVALHRDAVHLLGCNVRELLRGDQVRPRRSRSTLTRALSAVVVERDAPAPLRRATREVQRPGQVDGNASSRQGAVAGARVRPVAARRNATFDVGGQTGSRHVRSVADVPDLTVLGQRLGSRLVGLLGRHPGEATRSGFATTPATHVDSGPARTSLL